MSADLDDDALVKQIISSGVEPQLAARLVEFLPLAYGRVVLEKSGWTFPDYFQRLAPSGNLTQFSFDSDPVWVASIEFARTEIAKGIPSEQILALAARSAEVDAANKALNAGHTLAGGMMSPCTFEDIKFQ